MPGCARRDAHLVDAERRRAERAAHLEEDALDRLDARIALVQEGVGHARRYPGALAGKDLPRAARRGRGAGRTTRSRRRPRRPAPRAPPARRSRARSWSVAEGSPPATIARAVGAEREPARAGRERRDRALPEEHVDQPDHDRPLDAQRERAEQPRRRRTPPPSDGRERPGRGRALASSPGESAITMIRSPGRQSDDGRERRRGERRERRSRAARAASRRGTGSCRRRAPRRARWRRSRARGTAGSSGRKSGSMSVGERLRVGGARRPRR